jgi:hypothetical protein
VGEKRPRQRERKRFGLAVERTLLLRLSPLGVHAKKKKKENYGGITATRAQTIAGEKLRQASLNAGKTGMAFTPKRRAESCAFGAARLGRRRCQELHVHEGKAHAHRVRPAADLVRGVARVDERRNGSRMAQNFVEAYNGAQRCGTVADHPCASASERTPYALKVVTITKGRETNDVEEVREGIQTVEPQREAAETGSASLS